MKRLLVLLVCVGLTACENGTLRNRDKGALAGGALGAGLGAIVGNQVGSSGAGIAIGSAIGAIGGGLVGNSMDAQDERGRQTDERIRQQDRELAENRRMLDDLRARGIDVRTTDRGIVASLPDVLFEFNSARITGGARRAVGEIARVAQSARGRRIAVEGHTDSVGTVSYNQKLSLDRARSVADELVNDGVSSNLIVTRGFGEARSIASNSTEEGRRKNRRVEVVIENR